MVSARRGVTKLGCLMTLMIVVAVCYFGFQAGQVYFRFLEFQDANNWLALGDYNFFRTGVFLCVCSALR